MQACHPSHKHLDVVITDDRMAQKCVSGTSIDSGGRGRERERERNANARETSISCLSYASRLETKPITQACTLTGDWTRDSSVEGWYSNQLRHTSQGNIFIFKKKKNKLYFSKKKKKKRCILSAEHWRKHFLSSIEIKAHWTGLLLLTTVGGTNHWSILLWEEKAMLALFVPPFSMGSGQNLLWSISIEPCFSSSRKLALITAAGLRSE